ncbi:MAG: type II toxin-antitoxin system VapC family toxin [Opitutaceae bacterium]
MGDTQAVKYLLDSHVLDWAQTDEHRLSAKALTMLRDAKPGDLAVSDVTLSELARHLASGKIFVRIASEEWLHAATAEIEVLPVTHEIALRAAFLDWNHRDPCDRHIVATAAEYKLPLLTIDEKMHRLAGVRGLKVIW